MRDSKFAWVGSVLFLASCGGESGADLFGTGGSSAGGAPGGGGSSSGGAASGGAAGSAGTGGAAASGGSSGSGGSAASGGSGGGPSGGAGGSLGGTGGTSGSGGAGGATGGAGGATGGAGGATGGTGGTGGASGGTGGATGGTGGTGGTTGCTSTSQCASGEYCNTAKATCVSCTDLTRFEFGAPQKLNLININNQRFPRATHNGPELLYRTGYWNAEKAIWLSPDYVAGTAGTSFGAPVNVPSRAESGPLEAFITFGPLNGLTFFFDRTTVATYDGRRELFGGIRNGTSVTGLISLPPPINTPSSSNFSIAIALGAQRAYWMTDRFGSGGGMATVGLGANPSASASQVAIKLANGCSRSGFDSTPWVTANGQILLFSSLENGANCSVASDTRDIWMVRMDVNGQPTGNAVAVQAVNAPQWDDADPSLSNDMCWMLLSRDGGSTDNEYDPWRAPRI